MSPADRGTSSVDHKRSIGAPHHDSESRPSACGHSGGHPERRRRFSRHEPERTARSFVFLTRMQPASGRFAGAVCPRAKGLGTPLMSLRFHYSQLSDQLAPHSRRVRQVRDDAPPVRGETRVAIANPSTPPLMQRGTVRRRVAGTECPWPLASGTLWCRAASTTATPSDQFVPADCSSCWSDTGRQSPAR